MPKIPEEILERVAAANDIVEIVGSYLQLKRAGSTYRALCPFHQEKTPSFHVNQTRQSYHCFGCGAHGSVFRFLMEMEHIDFVSAVRRLAERAGIPVELVEATVEESASATLRRRLFELHEAAADWFHHILLRTNAAEHAREYLKSRGINKNIAVSWKLGYAPESWDAFSKFAQSKKFTPAELRTSGLVKPRDEQDPESDYYDRFRDRLMFPICDEQGRTIAFSGRVLNPEAHGGKYINSPETPLFTKGSVLFGLHKSRKSLHDIGIAIVCEGQLDLISAYENGVKNVIAPQGTAFTERQAQILKRHVEEVILCFDSDKAGQQAAERSLPALLQNNLIVRVATMPPGEDPDSTIRKHGPAVFVERLEAAQDFFDFQIERLSGEYNLETLRGKSQFARRLAESIVLIKETFLREAVLSRVAVRLGMSADDIRSLLKAAKPGAAPQLNKPESQRVETVLPPKPILLACQTVLSEPQAREWLLQQPWKPLLEQAPDCRLLMHILDANPGSEAGSVDAFLATLSAEEESALRAVLDAKAKENPMIVVQDWWHAFLRRDLNNRRARIQSDLKAPNLDISEMARLQREFLEVTERMNALPPPTDRGLFQR